MKGDSPLTSISLALSAVLAIVAVSSSLRSDEDPSPAPVDFAREILPVLSEKCFVCHGPDAKKKDFLRLDSSDAAARDLGGYRAIDRDAPENSEILVRIHSADRPMPPADSDRSLSPEERQLLDRWVQQGGEYARHWAFVAPRKAPLPFKPGVTGNPIDAFVGERLGRVGLELATQAGPSTLARRAALVLTGLPPEPQQLETFLTEESQGAYERLIDDLLDSTRFGEHQARYWLDAVRYGDTHGLHLDNRRGIYPYRDWVIRAFNDNLRLDDFITWQLAGDLLPNPSLAQRVATGFVRMNPSTAEGGALPEEFQVKNNFDRTETLGTVLLGMSLICARCHTHKYDPIPQTEYYRLLAFFNSTAEDALDANAYVYGPAVRVPEDQAGWREWSLIEAELDTFLAENETTTTPAIVAYAQSRMGWKSSDWQLSEIVATSESAPTEAGWKPRDELPGGTRHKYLPEVGQSQWVSFTIDVPTDQALWVMFSGGPGSEVTVDGAVQTIISNDSIDQRSTRALLELGPGPHPVLIKIAGTELPTLFEVTIENPWRVLAETKNWEACSKQDRLRMLADPRGPLSGLERHPLAFAIARRFALAQNKLTTTLVAADLGKPRETRVLQRGEYHSPIGEPLQPGILTVMSAFPENAPRNRLGLAGWLTARKHPLVARVLINRIWQRTFGEGLVRTPEDFGLQGEQPTHPELLDWLAVELQDSGWDLKHVLRLLVTSQTFRQSSARRDNVDDPENRLWARGPGHRLDAEVLRDLALWTSGLLDPHMGGEGVKPQQPPDLWNALAHPGSNTRHYVRDTGQRPYRRSIYVYWKRTSPHPMMTLFDAPSRESSCVRRSRTSTALQSLGLFNETQRLEMARALALRLLRHSPDDETRLNLLFRLVACREPSDRERESCTGLLHTMRSRYANSEAEAKALLAVGDSRPDPGADSVELDPREHAAWSQLAITVLASDLALLLY